MKTTGFSATFEPGDLTLLTYAMHMAETARSGPARRLFEEYVDVELRRFEAERLLLPANENGDGVARTKVRMRI